MTRKAETVRCVAAEAGEARLCKSAPGLAASARGGAFFRTPDVRLPRASAAPSCTSYGIPKAERIGGEAGCAPGQARRDWPATSATCRPFAKRRKAVARALPNLSCGNHAPCQCRRRKNEPSFLRRPGIFGGPVRDRAPRTLAVPAGGQYYGIGRGAGSPAPARRSKESTCSESSDAGPLQTS